MSTNLAHKIDGLVIKEIVYAINDNTYLAAHTFINDDIPEDESREMFDNLVEAGKIRDCKYNDLTWKLHDYSTNSLIKIDFMFSLSKEIITSIKNYILVRLERLNVSTISMRRVRNIMDMLNKTNCLDLEYLSTFRKYLNEKDAHYYYECLNFLEFTNIDNAYEYYKEISNMNFAHLDVTRNIPSFESIIKFDFIINDFIASGDFYLKMKYYPILIWWKIGTIIPIRPMEILILKRNYLYKKNNKCFLHIKRVKEKQGNKAHATAILEDFEIPESIYEFIENYIYYVSVIDDTEFIFSRKVYEKHFVKSIEKESNDRIYMNEVTMYLDGFYRDVVKNIYEYEEVKIGQLKEDNQIERMRFGDPRHLAFMNMMMQGFNPLYIQRMGGHYTLEEQMHYCNHLDTFATSKSQVVSKIINHKKNNMNQPLENAPDWRLKEITKNRMGLDFYKLPIVQDGAGRCTSTNVPNDCNCEECLYCEHFLYEKDVFQDYLEEEKIRNDNNLCVAKNLMNSLLTNIDRDYLENKMQQETSSIASYSNKSMVINAYMQREENLIGKTT